MTLSTSFDRYYVGFIRRVHIKHSAIYIWQSQNVFQTHNNMMFMYVSNLHALHGHTKHHIQLYSLFTSICCAKQSAAIINSIFSSPLYIFGRLRVHRHIYFHTTSSFPLHCQYMILIYPHREAGFYELSLELDSMDLLFMHRNCSRDIQPLDRHQHSQ